MAIKINIEKIAEASFDSLFKLDTQTRVLTFNYDWLKLVPEFRRLLVDDTDSSKFQAFKELAFIYLYADKGQPFHYLRDEDKSDKITKTLGMDRYETIPPKVRKGIKKYEELQLEISTIARAFNVAKRALDDIPIVITVLQSQVNISKNALDDYNKRERLSDSDRQTILYHEDKLISLTDKILSLTAKIPAASQTIINLNEMLEKERTDVGKKTYGNLTIHNRES